MRHRRRCCGCSVNAGTTSLAMAQSVSRCNGDGDSGQRRSAGVQGWFQPGTSRMRGIIGDSIQTTAGGANAMTARLIAQAMSEVPTARRLSQRRLGQDRDRDGASRQGWRS